MVEILFRLFVWNSNEELRRTTISSHHGIVEYKLFSLFRNNGLTFGYITAISILKTATILLFLAHPNIPVVN
jgi:hypothetical protein